MTHILVVEDEPSIAFGLETDLQAEGYRTTVAVTGPEAVGRAQDGGFDLILLDVMLPGKDGFEVCREIRRAGIRTPVVLLTARTHDAEKVMGLELGADDYITKPFNPRELRARIKAVLRRTAPPPAPVFRFADVSVDFERCEVKRGDAVVDLSALEFKLLSAFIRHKGRLLSREQLLDLVWGQGVALNDRAVDNHIVALRRKLEPDPGDPRHIINVRGLGYRFDA
jgi:DNA-binding response OmpR family regulator